MRISGPADTHNRHKKSFPIQVQEIIRISDVILEVLDARNISGSRILALESMIKEKGSILIHVVNKVDLIDFEMLKTSEVYEELSNPVFISCTKKIGIGKLRERIHILAKKFTEHAQAHIGVIGYPNTGKSSVISMLARRKVAPVSSHSGFTKGIRKIRFAKGIQLLDTPGVISEKENLFTDKDVKKHALMGVHVSENVRNPDLIVFEIMKRNPEKIENFYGVEEKGDVETLLEELGRRWNLIKKKGEVDGDKTARRILKDWHQGKMN